MVHIIHNNHSYLVNELNETRKGEMGVAIFCTTQLLCSTGKSNWN